MTFKVTDNKSDAHFTHHNAQSQDHGNPQTHHSTTNHGITHAHDNTPLRQRELQNQGHQNRAKVEGHSNKHHGQPFESQSSHRGDGGSHGYQVNLRTGRETSSGEGHIQAQSASEHSPSGVFRGRSEADGGYLPSREGHASSRSHASDSQAPSWSRSDTGQGPHESHVTSDGRWGDSGTGSRVDDSSGPSWSRSQDGRGPQESDDSRGPSWLRSQDGRGLQESHDSRGPSWLRSHDGHGPHHSDDSRGPSWSRSQDGRGPHESHDSRGPSWSRSHDGHGPYESSRDHRGPSWSQPELRGTRESLRGPHDELDLHGRWRQAENFSSETRNQVRRLVGETLRLPEELRDPRSHGRHGQVSDPPNRIFPNVVEPSSYRDRPDVLWRDRLTQHFSRLEHVAGEPARRAYEAVNDFLLRDRSTRAWPDRFVNELLRDLRTGAFLHAQDVRGTFPLTGRARVVSEMIELLRTLDAIQRYREQMPAGFRIPWAEYQGALMGTALKDLLATLPTNSMPMLPGLAGRFEIPQVVLALNGFLTDAAGRPLLMVDGHSLKLGEMIWFNMWGDSLAEMWLGDRFQTRLSPLLVHGFEAIYSVVGFDGRPLAMPRFLAIQSQVNASEFEWLFAQSLFLESWIRSAIEYLKDSVSFDYNILGELLEEALTSGRFHLAVMRGMVEDGRAVPGSFTFAPAYNLDRLASESIS